MNILVALYGSDPGVPGRSRKLNLNMNMIFTLCNWGWLRLAPTLVIASNWIRLDQTGSKSRLNQVHKDQRVEILVLGGSREYHFWNKIPLFLRFCAVGDSVEPFLVKSANEMARNSRWVIERNLNASDNNILMQLFLDIQAHNIISPCHHRPVAQNHPLSRHPSVVNWQFFEYSLFEFIAPE